MPRPRREHAELWERYGRTRSEADRNALVAVYLPLVRRMAWKMDQQIGRQAVHDAESLENAGVFGLIEAIEHFDPSRGYYFGTFAHWRIKGAMLDELRAYDWVPRLERLRAKRGEATPQTVGEFPVLAGDEGKLLRYEHDVLADPRPGPTARSDVEEFWREHTRGLDQTERLLVLLYFREGLTMRQIGETVGCSESRVSQRFKDIKRRLKQGAQQTDVRRPRIIPAGQDSMTRNGDSIGPGAANITAKPETITPPAKPEPPPNREVRDGSPAARSTDRKREHLATYCTTSEKRAIQAAAKAAGLSVAAWLRQTALAAAS